MRRLRAAVVADQFDLTPHLDVRVIFRVVLVVHLVEPLLRLPLLAEELDVPIVEVQSAADLESRVFLCFLGRDTTGALARRDDVARLVDVAAFPLRTLVLFLRFNPFLPRFAGVLDVSDTIGVE